MKLKVTHEKNNIFPVYKYYTFLVSFVLSCSQVNIHFDMLFNAGGTIPVPGQLVHYDLFDG